MANSAQARKRARQAEATSAAQREPQVDAAHRGQEGEEGDRRRRQGRRDAAAAGVAGGDRPHRRQEDRAQEHRVAHEVAPRAGDQGAGLTGAAAPRPADRAAGGSAEDEGARGRPFALGGGAGVLRATAGRVGILDPIGRVADTAGTPRRRRSAKSRRRSRVPAINSPAIRLQPPGISPGVRHANCLTFAKAGARRPRCSS